MMSDQTNDGCSNPNSNKCINESTKENNTQTLGVIDGGFGWVIVIAAFLCNVIVDGIIYSMGMIEDELLNEFNEGKSFTSWVPSTQTAMQLCSGPIASSLTKKYGCRSVIIAGSILSACSFFIGTYAQNVSTLIITIGFAAGTGFGLIYLPVIVSVTIYFKKFRSAAIGIAAAGAGVGASTFAPLFALLIKQFGWRGCLMIVSGIILNCSIFGAFFRPLKQNKQIILAVENGQINQRSNRNSMIEKTKDNIKQEEIKEEVSLSKLCCTRNFIDVLKSVSEFMNLNFLKNPAFALFTLSDFAASLCFYVPYYSLASYSSSLGMKEAGAHLLTIAGIVNIFGRFIVGYISDKSWANRLWIDSACLIICGIAIVGLIGCTGLLSLAICSAIFGFTNGACVPMRSVIIADLIGLEGIESAFGLLLLFEGIGTFVGPPIDGFFYDLSKSFTPGFIFCGSMIALSGFILIFIPALQKCVNR